MRIDFNEEKHEYSVDGEKVPSVSEILAPISADRYKDINQSVLAQAAARGTAVHEACEAIDYGLDPEIDPSIEGYIRAYYTFLRDYTPKWEMIERIIGYVRYVGDKPYYCGTIDRYGMIDGKPCVVDIKTYASLTTDAYISASCQTALYRDAIESHQLADGTPDMVKGLDAYSGDGGIIKRYVLHLKPDGNYRLASLDNFDKEREFRSGAVAWSLVNLYYDKQKAYRKKGKKKDGK